jgi:predicted nucleic acid-binding protein
MANRTKTSKRVSPIFAAPELADFWTEQIRTLGRNVFYIDTGGILKVLEGDDTFIEFFNSVVGQQLLTSTYVLSEVVRRIVKASHPERFSGPNGERGSDLAAYILTDWIQDNNVHVICPPEAVFRAAKSEFVRNRSLGCDLVDVMSYVIVIGLQQTRIVSADTHFRSLGLVCYPD